MQVRSRKEQKIGGASLGVHPCDRLSTPTTMIQAFLSIVKAPRNTTCLPNPRRQSALGIRSARACNPVRVVIPYGQQGWCLLSAIFIPRLLPISDQLDPARVILHPIYWGLRRNAAPVTHQGHTTLPLKLCSAPPGRFGKNDRR